MKPIISPNIRVRYPDHFVIGDDSIVDDYSYFSTRITVGRGSHLASGLTIGGGVQHRFHLGDRSGIGAGTRIYVTSSDFIHGIVSADGKPTTSGDVIFGNFTGIGCNSLVMPNNHIPEGVTIGAMSLVPSAYPFEPWTMYAGKPLKKIVPRDRDRVLRNLL